MATGRFEEGADDVHPICSGPDGNRRFETIDVRGKSSFRRNVRRIGDKQKRLEKIGDGIEEVALEKSDSRIDAMSLRIRSRHVESIFADVRRKNGECRVFACQTDGDATASGTHVHDRADMFCDV